MSTRRRRGRAAFHWVALVLAALLALLSALAIWTRNQVLDTDRYVATVARRRSSAGSCSWR
jgi:hypothetical protein